MAARALKITPPHRLALILAVLCLLCAPAAAATLTFTVNTSRPVTVTGTPRLAIDVGGITRYATYASGSGTAALAFSYVIQSGDFDGDGIALVSPLQLNGGTIVDSVGNPATNLAFTVPDTSNLKVQTYTAAFTTSPITQNNAAAVDFTIAKAPTGASFSYSITSSGGAGSVTGSGTISGASHAVSGVDVSALPAGTLTLSVTVSTAAGGTGTARTTTAAKTFTGVLDSLPAAVAAYSVRRLSGSYTGPLLRVRRASDNTETDIAATVAGNLDTATLASFCSATSCFVRSWYDQSGNGRTASQATAASQPRIVNAGSIDQLGSRPAVRFLAAQALAATAPLAAANEYSLVMTTVERSRRGAVGWKLLTSGFASRRVFAHTPWSDGVLYYDQGTAFAPYRISKAWSVALNTASVLSFLNSSSAATRGVYLNGALFLSGTGYEAPCDTLGFGDTYDGNYGELVLFSSSLPSASRLAMERSAGSYFGISVP